MFVKKIFIFFFFYILSFNIFNNEIYLIEGYILLLKLYVLLEYRDIYIHIQWEVLL